MNPGVGAGFACAPESRSDDDDTALLASWLAAHHRIFKSLEDVAASIIEGATLMTRTLRGGGKLMFCGNGGSAADCQHLAAEFVGRFHAERPALAALALTTDTSVLSCIGNDYAFEEIFARQVRAHGRVDDCLVLISTSGRSPNVLNAARAARERGVATIALTGRDGGALAPLCDHAVIVRGDDTARIQEAHIFVGHAWCGLVEDALLRH